MNNAQQDFDTDSLTEVVTTALAEAKASGASSAEVSVSRETGLSVGVRLGEVETLEHHRDQGVGITVYFGHRKGSASTSQLTAAAISETAQAACRIAKYTAIDSAAGLADAACMAKEFPNLDIYHPWGLVAEEAITTAQQCEAAARDSDTRITNSEGASVNTHQGVRIYGNSHGFIGMHPSSRHSIDCSVIADDAGTMERDFWYSVARDPADLESPEQVGRSAAERTLMRLGSKRLPTGSVPVLFSPEVARSLLGHLLAAIRGGALYRRASFLLDQLGEQIFPAWAQIVERPHIVRGLGSASFDHEGIATRDRDIVKDGVLSSYLLDSYAARKLKMESPDNSGSVHNLLLQPGDVGQAELLRQMDRGLLVTELMGQGVNTVTGDYSKGATGFWVEGGQISHPVHEITIASNLRDMFAGLVAVGNDIDCRGNIRCGSVLVEQMTVAGE